MKNPRILIVEDEGIVVLDIQRRLEDLGYAVIGHVNAGKKAIDKANEERPDLILMDIKLQGEMDGIDAAEKINELDIPIVYLTAFADNATLNRAKITEPFGYILKPFEQRELHTAIQIALHNHKLSQEIKKNQKWLAATLSGIGDAVIATNREYEIEFINPVAENLLGWQASEMIGNDIHKYLQFFRLKDESEIDAPIKECIEGKSLVASNELVYLMNKEGTRIPIDFSAAPTDQYGAVLVIRDISKLIAMEGALRESETLFRSLAGMAPAGIFRADQQGNCIYANNHLLELTGLSNNEILNNGWLNRLHPEDKLRIEEAWQATIQNKLPFKEEHRFQRKDNQITWVISEAHPVQLGETQAQSFIGAVMNITKRKEAETELQTLNEGLEERVKERTSELSLIINAMAGREVRMADLKKVIKKLRAQLKDSGLSPVADDPLNEEIY
jgi:PAS domain S-box-containing protein